LVRVELVELGPTLQVTEATLYLAQSPQSLAVVVVDQTSMVVQVVLVVELALLLAALFLLVVQPHLIKASTVVMELTLQTKVVAVVAVALVRLVETGRVVSAVTVWQAQSLEAL
jgi:hypothetical protein